MQRKRGTGASTTRLFDVHEDLAGRGDAQNYFCKIQELKTGEVEVDAQKQCSQGKQLSICLRGALAWHERKPTQSLDVLRLTSISTMIGRG